MATHGHHVPEATTATRTWDLTPPEIVRDGVRGITSAVGSTYRLALIVCAVLAALGVVGLILGPILSGWGDRQAWIYTMVACGFLISVIGAAPAFSAALRLARGHWRRPVNRVAELWAAALIVPYVLFLLLIWLLPGTGDRPTLWFGWPGSPWLWHILMLTLLVGTGYAFLYFSSVPDFAVLRNRREGATGDGWFTKLAGDWVGSEQQWRVHERSVALLGSFYILAYVGMMTLLAADFIQALVPGYHSSIFPLYFTVTGMSSGIAVTILLAAGLRKWGYDVYLEREHFFALSRILLATCLLWFYLWFTDFIIMWYGRMPHELAKLELLYFGPYLPLFITVFFCMFFGPLLLLMWTAVRKGIVGPTIAAALVVFGILIDRIRLYSASFSVEDITAIHLYRDDVPPAYIPNLWDILIVVGMLAAAFGLVLLALRVVPYPSIWEMTSGLWLRVKRRWNQVDVIVIGKPD